MFKISTYITNWLDFWFKSLIIFIYNIKMSKQNKKESDQSKGYQTKLSMFYGGK